MYPLAGDAEEHSKAALQGQFLIERCAIPPSRIRLLASLIWEGARG